MKVLFHTNALNYRGTTTAIADYAKYNQEILGNESVICYNSSLPNEKEMGNVPEVIQKLKESFEVRSYDTTDRIDQLTKDIDVGYFIRAGQKEFLPTNCRTAVHSVFQIAAPHGDKYAYISRWLAEKMSTESVKYEYVPHIVDLPEANKDLREKLGIPKDAFVFGRLGGYDTFDLQWTYKQIEEYLDQNKGVYFVFVNTKPFSNHPNIKYVKEIISKQGKSNFIASCDAMIHARARGESFGLSIAEFLFHDKPVVAWEGGIDKNHLQMLAGSPTIYGPNDFKNKLTLTIEEASKMSHKWRVEQFQPKPVMEKFKEVFLWT